MKVRVDPRLCQGHNRCISVAPDLFDIDEEGFSSAMGDGTVPPGMQDLAGLAVDNCPEQAISLRADA